MALLNSLIPSLHRNTAPAEENSTPSLRPVFDIKETAEAWGVTVHLPGVAKNGLTITDEDGVLTLRGERSWKQPSGWTSLYRESSDLPFQLALRHDQAVDADKAHAELRDGVLRLSLPKAEAKKPRKIAIA